MVLGCKASTSLHLALRCSAHAGGTLSALGSLAAREGQQAALMGALAAGGPLAAEYQRLRRELHAAREQQTRLESKVRHLQQQLAAGSSSGGRMATRGRSDVLERERLADAQVGWVVVASGLGRLPACTLLADLPTPKMQL